MDTEISSSQKAVPDAKINKIQANRIQQHIKMIMIKQALYSRDTRIPQYLQNQCDIPY